MDIFYFGRLNYIGERSLLDLLQSGYKYRSDHNTKYGIFDVETIEDSDLGKIYTGELVKYNDVKSEDVIKDDQISKENIFDAIKGTSRFYLTETDHIIAYNPYGRILSDRSFRKAFSGVIIAGDDSFIVDSVIFPVNIEHQFRELFENMKLLSKLTFNLTPSNPNNRDVWKKIDEKLGKMRVKKYKEEFLAKEGESIELDEESKAKMVMAEDGYGKVIGQGKDQDDNDVVISTDKKENILKGRIEKELSVKNQIESLKRIYKNIRERFNKN